MNARSAVLILLFASILGFGATTHQAFVATTSVTLNSQVNNAFVNNAGAVS
jgi:hypothetical protein